RSRLFPLGAGESIRPPGKPIPRAHRQELLMLHNLYVGLRIALGLSLERHRLQGGWCAFWFIALLSVFTSFTFDLAFSAPPRLFQPEALLSESFTLIGILLAATVVGALLGAPLQLRLPVAFLNGCLWV